jgi:aminoglycoside 6'-N-acetyltransferase
MQKLKLIPARLDHVSLLRHWDEQPHVLASDPNDDWEWETELARNPSWREQLIAEWEGKPIGFVQIIDPAEEESHYWGQGQVDVPAHVPANVRANLRAIDIWIGEADYLGKGLGTLMMRLAIERCFAPPEVEAILIDPLESNTRAHRFYERLGFEIVGPKQFGEDLCLVYRLNRARWQSYNHPL